MNQPPSSGKTIAVAGMSATQGVTLLLYVCHKLGIQDMTVDVASAIICIAAGAAGAVIHDVQRKRERREKERHDAIKATEVGPV